MSFPTEEELKIAFANLGDPDQRSEAVGVIYRAADEHKVLAVQYRNVRLEFDEIKGIVIARLLQRNEPIEADRPKGLLYRILDNLYLEEIEREKRRRRLENPAVDFDLVVSAAPSAGPSFTEEYFKTVGKSPDELLEELCEVILPGRCGKMKNVPEKVRHLYQEVEKYHDTGESPNYSARERKDHERVRLKVQEVVATYVLEDAKKLQWNGFVDAYLRMRDPSVTK